MARRNRFKIDMRDRFNLFKGANVASAANLTFGKGNYFDITGTATCTYVNKAGWKAGALLVLRFNGSLTVTNMGGSPPTGYAKLRLDGGANISATDKDIIAFIFDGTEFSQISKISLNA